MIHIYYGEGKGKTTAAAGLALREAGWGNAVLFVQFLKSTPSGEIIAMEGIGNITVLRDNAPWAFSWNMDEDERSLAGERVASLLQKADKEISGGQWDMVVLDEVLGAWACGFLSQSCLLETMASFREEGRPELVLTGRKPFPDALAMADYATEMRKEKHPYDNRAQARKGIEY